MKTKWYQGLVGGIDQATDSTLVANNDSPHLQNIILDQPGNWATRAGILNVGAQISASDEGWGIEVYNTEAGAHSMLAVSERDLWLLTEVGATWGKVGTDRWPADTRVDSVNFLNRLYLGSGDGATALGYSTGADVTFVTPLIGGNKLAVNKGSLAVGGNSLKRSVVFHTDPLTDRFYSVTGTVAANADVAGANTLTLTSSILEPEMEQAYVYNPTDTAMNLITDWQSGTVITTDASTATWDNDTVYILQNNFKQDNANTGLTSYGGNFVSFDPDTMYIWDVTSNPPYLETHNNFGCADERTVQTVDGSLIFANREGVYLYSGNGTPEDITPKIRDKVGGTGVWDLLNAANWGNICSGAKPSEGKYFLSIGTLNTLSGASVSGLTNVVLVFDTKRGAWTIRTYPERIYDFATFINSSGVKGLYGISTNARVFNMDTGTSDILDNGTTAITTVIHTPHYVLGDPTATQRVKGFFVKYTCTATVTVKQSLNRGLYGGSGGDTLGTLPIASTVVVAPIRPRADSEGFSHSLEFVTTGKLVLEAVGFEYFNNSTLKTIPI